MTITEPKLRTAVDDYADAIIAISIRERQIFDIDIGCVLGGGVWVGCWWVGVGA